jgi:hypothetical protein
MDPDDENAIPPIQIGSTLPDADTANVDDGSGPDLSPPPPYHPPWYKLHPGLAESMIPVWGPARETLVDRADGDVLGSLFNTGLAVADLFGVGELVGDPIKIGSHTWPATRKWMTQNGLAQKGQVVHHAIFERNQGIGKYLPDWFKNQPFNLKPMPSAQIHDRMTHAAWGQPQLNFFQQWHYGTPDWAKWIQAGTTGSGAQGLWGLLGDWRAHPGPNNPQTSNSQQGGRQ